MVVIGHNGTGAARSPLLLILLRCLVCAGPLLWAVEAQAQAEQAAASCRFISHSPIHAEGFDGPDTFGVRLTIRDDRWVWTPARGGAIAACPSCSSLAKGVLRIGLAPFYAPSDDYQLRRETEQQSATPVEFALHPRTIAVGLWAMTNFMPRSVTAMEITPVTLLGTSALARAVTIDSAGNIVHGIAVAMQDGCFSLFAVFFREDNGPVGVEDLEQIDAAMKLDKYAPRFKIEQLQPRPPRRPSIEFPLGNARKQLEEQQKDR
jgi:hypothetical protein